VSGCFFSEHSVYQFSVFRLSVFSLLETASAERWIPNFFRIIKHR